MRTDSPRTQASHESGPIVVDSHDTLAQLRAAVRAPRSLPGDPVVLDERFVGESAGSFEERFNEVYLDCGCGVGAVAVWLGIAGYIAWMIGSGGAHDWMAGIWAVPVVVATGTLGKLVGLVRNRILLLALIRQIEQRARQRRGEGSA